MVTSTTAYGFPRVARGILAVLLLAGCTGTAIVRVEPPGAHVTVDQAPLRNNWMPYGRWIGNEYMLEASAPGYEPAQTVADVHLGSRCGLVAFYSLVSILGAPIALTCPWQGQMEDEIVITLRPMPPDGEPDVSDSNDERVGRTDQE